MNALIQKAVDLTRGVSTQLDHISVNASLVISLILEYLHLMIAITTALVNNMIACCLLYLQHL